VSVMDSILEETIPPLHFRRRPKAPRGLSRFERWAWSPITAYRVGLTLGYLATVYFGTSAFIAGVPAFQLTAPSGWTPIWASVLIIGGVVATIGSASSEKAFERTELVGAWALFLTLGCYAATLLWLAYSEGDSNRAAAGAGFVALGVAPGVRLLWLMSQLGRKPAPVVAEQ
jgi:hypothetical protein